MALITETKPLLLASGSPRRRDILGMLGIPNVVVVKSVDETTAAEETARAYLTRIVEVKRNAARASFDFDLHAALLVADTSVIVEAAILGKPESVEDARIMMHRLAGRAHEVHTRFLVWTPEREHAETVVTQVFFRALDEDQITRYIATGEGTDKAGGYAIQGRGSALVSKILGSYTNVVGLPACELVVALEHLGLWS